jgi:4-amino-4-deoxy-L-arabinose transferase-like glycosyltransferase
MTERQKDHLEKGPQAAQEDALFRAAATGSEALSAPGGRASDNDLQSEDGSPNEASREAGDEACIHANGSAQRKASIWTALRDALESKLLLGNKGNPPRLLRGGLTAVIGGLAAFTLMAAETQLRWGILLGVAAVAVASFGILDLVGSFDDPDEQVAHRTSLTALKWPLLATFGSLAATLALLGARVQGRLSIVSAAILVTTSFAALIVSVYRVGVVLGPFASDETGEARPLHQRHGFWVVFTGTLLYLPMMGSFSLLDPWETHYGEVAREMLSRNDWISTWWATEGWFWSKPVLNFWVQALSMGLLGADWRAGRMLATVDGNTPWPEWATRMPVFVMTIVALYFLYKGVANVYGRRAGMLGALILATMPQWFLLAHQTMTDMPLVAALSASMGLLLLGMHTDGDRRVLAYEVTVRGTKWRFSAYHLVFGVILLTALPQILYLWSRNAELSWLPDVPGFRFRADQFSAGSKGNCGLPGNEACHNVDPALPGFQPAIQGLLWAAICGVVLYLNWGERRAQRLLFLAAWYFGAVATLGKGPAGFGLPLCVTFLYVAVTRKWTKLLSLEIISGLLIIMAVALPWYVAMYVRHGHEFTDRLIFHDMYKRAMVHVHDTNEGDDVSFRYYIWQLGYAFFPWTGLVPAALVWWARRRDDAAKGEGDVSVFLATWFVFAFGLFTAVLTKFHHYIFPAVPPVAMLTGILVDRLLGPGSLHRDGKTAILGRSFSNALVYYGAMGAACLALFYGLSLMFPGSVNGFVPREGTVAPASPALGALVIAAGIGMAIACVKKLGRGTDTRPAASREAARTFSHEEVLLAGVAVAAAIVMAVVGRDLAGKSGPRDNSGQARLMHLFTYNYTRQWPESIDFAGVLAAVAILAVVLCLLLMVARMRRHIAVLLCGTSLVFTAWALDFYLPKAAPHWGQREVIAAYYKSRGSEAEPIAAYHMDWKGENFYTGNHVAAFTSGTGFGDYIKKERGRGVKTMWFVTDLGRTAGLKNELGNPKKFEVLTDRWLNKNFCLSKAEFD